MRSKWFKSKLNYAGIASALFLHIPAFYSCAEAGPVSPEQLEYLESLVKTSADNSLANDRAWHVLLHYRPNSLRSGVTSEVDGTGFFLAEDGKTKSKAELDATLKSFFSQDEIGNEKLTSQCAFPARYRWLDSQLQFDSVLMPVQGCEALELWRDRVEAESVSLIFSSYFLNNPASMFGHTLLRFNRNDSENSRLLDFAINYAAVLDADDNPLAYAWKGLTGGYEGRFSLTPYYDMVKQYNDIDHRDLWEYRLNLSPEQTDMLLLHIWEIARTHFEYFFFKENCSYHLLALLDVADPELHLTDSFWAWTLPTDTIKRVASIPGLVDNVIWRPSLSSQLEQRFDQMTDAEKGYVKQLTISGVEASSDFNSLPPERRAVIIDTAINFLHYKNSSRDRNTERRNDEIYALLLQRSKLPESALQVSKPGLVPPDKGHDAARFEISGGRYSQNEATPPIGDQSFLEISVQPGFHDLLSPEDGHAPNSQINFLNLRARYESGSKKWRLQQFTLVDMISLFPLTSLVSKPSWKIKAGWEPNRDIGCNQCTPFIFSPGIGITLQSTLHKREVYFAFLEANLEFDKAFISDHRAGFGATVGLLFDATERWRFELVANRTRYTEGQRGYISTVELRQRFTLSQNLEITLNARNVESFREGNLGIAYYF